MCICVINVGCCKEVMMVMFNYIFVIKWIMMWFWRWILFVWLVIEIFIVFFVEFFYFFVRCVSCYYVEIVFNSIDYNVDKKY